MIRGYFDALYQPPVPIIVVGLILPHRPTAYTPIEFVLDTGASTTCLHPRDALQRAHFSEAELEELARTSPQDRSLTGITGIGEYFVLPVRYLLGHDDGHLDLLDGELRVARPRPANMNIPSVLGWDILERYRIILGRRTGEVLLQ